MSTQHTPGPFTERTPLAPLTQKERRTLERMKINWSRLTREQKDYALMLGNRAWLAEKAAEERAAIAKATGGAA